MSTTRVSRSVVLQTTPWIGLFLLFSLTGDTANRPWVDYLIIAWRITGFAVYYNLLYYAVLPLYFTDRKPAFYTWGVLAFTAYAAFSLVTDLVLINAVLNGSGAPPLARPLMWTIIPAVFIGLGVFGVAATFRAFTAFEEKKKSEAEAKRQRLEAEIALLKSQINPHFLLNTINNLYALSLTEPDKTPDGLYKLSQMVSYILYECASPCVPLARDLQFVESYISLQRLRLPPNATLHVTLPELPAADFTIEPMILLPFIENAFKHGLTTREPCTIDISIAVTARRLNLRVTNPLLEKREAQAGNPSGIGMANTRQRLDHTYAYRYALQVDAAGDRHRVELELDLV